MSYLDAYWDVQQSKLIYTSSDPHKIKVSNFVLSAPYLAVKSSYDFKISEGGVVQVTNDKNKTASLRFKATSTANITYAQATILDGNNTPKSAQVKLSNVEFVADKVSIQLSELSSKAQQVNFKEDGITEQTLLPTEVIFKGVVQQADTQEKLNLEAVIKLNNDLSKTIDITNGETATTFINADLALKLSGNLLVNKLAKPFSLEVTANRKELVKGTADVVINVANDKLTINLIANQVADIIKVAIKVSHDNGAYLNITDVDSFTTTDIRVGNTKYGTVNKVSNAQYVATFTDNSTKYIAP